MVYMKQGGLEGPRDCSVGVVNQPTLIAVAMSPHEETIPTSGAPINAPFSRFSHSEGLECVATNPRSLSSLPTRRAGGGGAKDRDQVHARSVTATSEERQ